jgi:hypothetical protein
MADISKLDTLQKKNSEAVPVRTITPEKLPRPKESPSDKNEKEIVNYIVKMGEKIYDIANGYILTKPFNPYIWNSTRRLSEAKFVLNDPNSTILGELSDGEEIQVSIGFVNGIIRNKFIGKIVKIGRMPPSGTIVTALDQSVVMGGDVASSTILSSDIPPDQSRKVEDISSGGKVISSFSGMASVYQRSPNDPSKGKTANGSVFSSSALAAAHKTLPFGTTVRVTPVSGKKSVLVQVNDRPTNEKAVILLTKAAWDTLGVSSTTAPEVKVEVMSSSSSAIAQPESMKSIQPTPANDVFGKASLPSSIQSVSPSTVAPTPDASIFQPGKVSTAETFVLGATDLKYADKSDFSESSEGIVRIEQSQLRIASMEAAIRGETLVARGNTIRQSGANSGEPSGLVLDYINNPSAFISDPVVSKKTPKAIQSGFGALTIQGYNPTEKQIISVTAVTPAPSVTVPGGVIQVPEWGALRMSDPIFPGSVYTWGDATKGGTRKPNKAIMERIVLLAKAITPLTEQTVGKGRKWTINSWYRDPAANRRAGSGPNSRHLRGDAVDFIFPGYMKLWAKLPSTWNGGYAISPGAFIHLDLGQKRTWKY